MATSTANGATESTVQHRPGNTDSLIEAFERTVRQFPQRTCLTFVDKNGAEAAYSYREVRMYAAALAWHLHHKGVGKGAAVSVDLPNCPLYVLLILAAAYGEFFLVPINHRLSAGQKLTCLLELERASHVRIAYRIDESHIKSLFNSMNALLAGEDPRIVAGFQSAQSAQNAKGNSGSLFGKDVAGTLGHSPDARRISRTHASSMGRTIAAAAQARSTRALGRAKPGLDAKRRQDAQDRQDAIETIMHFAERNTRTFSLGALALVMFTSGSTGKPKAVPLTWANLCGSAAASNSVLNPQHSGAWQTALPLYHVGGFQTVVRSLLNETPIVLYERFDAAFVLRDAYIRHLSHVSVVDKVLQDMISLAQQRGGSSTEARALSGYRCILLGGAALNPKTLRRAFDAKARVYASYGMTETSSQIANTLVDRNFDGGLQLLPGYTVRIVDPDEEGFGKLAVKGPGVTAGYLNARTPHTVDGFLLTGDTAAFGNGRLYLRERTQDMFVSGGENIYPSQIRTALVQLPKVDDAYVFGAPDETWGRRPVAFVESAQDEPPQPAEIMRGLSRSLSKLYLPREVYVTTQLPRTGIGKIDRMAIEGRWERRLDVESVTLYRIRLPFVKPFVTAKETLSHRDALIVELQDREGRTGLGECVAFTTDWYLPEILDDDERVIRDVLAPAVTREVYLHPSEASLRFAAKRAAVRFPMARAAVESALWDLYGQITEKPLWKLIGGTAPNNGSVAAGAVVGIGDPQLTVEAVQQCVSAGYKRVKLKVAPGNPVDAAQAVRNAFPQLMITLDANQSFIEEDIGQLRRLDELGAAWIEEPLDPARAPMGGPSETFTRLARLQRQLRTPICLDESIVTPSDAARALRFSELRCYALKIAKLGGVRPALEFAAAALERGCTVWMGGMYDTGISKSLHAAFQTLPGIDAPGDIGNTSRYFQTDICDPAYASHGGMVQLNPGDCSYGIGRKLDRSALKSVTVRSVTIRQ